MKSRKRNCSLTIRLTDNEKQYIKRKAEKLQMSLTDFIIASTLKKPVGGSENLNDILIKLKPISDKLNHIETEIRLGNFEANHFQDILDMQKNLFETICEMTRNGEGKNKAGKSTGATDGSKCPQTPTGSAVRGWCCKRASGSISGDKNG